MPQVRPPERDEAMRMWLESDGKLTIQNIAIQLNRNPGTVRGWKSKDEWDEALAERHRAEGKKPPKPSPQANRKNSYAKGHGAPKGNHNGDGHGAPKGNGNSKGHGAPKGHKNNLKHGAFERFAFQYMDEDERQVAEETEFSTIEDELKRALAFVKARELRLIKRIQAIREAAAKGKADALTGKSVTKSEKRMGLWYKEDGEYVKEEGTGMYDGEWLDQTVSTTASIEDLLNPLEAELTRVQGQKVKILTQLDTMHTNRERLEIERLRAQGENEQSKLANDWVEALLSLYGDGAQGGDAE